MEKIIDKITKDNVLGGRVITMFLILLLIIVPALTRKDEFPEDFVGKIRMPVAGKIYKVEQPISVRPMTYNLFIKTQNGDSLVLKLDCKKNHLGDSIYKAADDIYVEIHDSTKMIKIPLRSRIAYEVHTNPRWPVEWRDKWPELNGQYVYFDNLIIIVFVLIFIRNLHYLIKGLSDARNE